MLTQLKKKSKLKWLGDSPQTDKKAVLLIPQYNESLNMKIEERLKYFSQLAEEFRSLIDIVVIDDGSTDGSLNMIDEFRTKNNSPLYIAAVYPNANKVGALSLAVSAVTHELIILSDFDTDILGLKLVIENLEFLNNNPTLMGCYFRMLPFEGSGQIFLFQQLEYSLQRILYKFHNSGDSAPVMPGAGSCFKRDVLLSIYGHHSGFRNGEDRESTLIGFKLGYKTFYLDSILTLTRPPLSFKALLKQRIRWNLGYIETLSKEYRFYFSQIRKRTDIGIRTLVDLLMAVIIVLVPGVILISTMMNVSVGVMVILFVYISYVLYTIKLTSISVKESREFKGQLIKSMLFFPIIKISLDFLAWTNAGIIFVSNSIKFRKQITQ